LKPFVCEFCKTKLSSETFLVKHMCEQKRRWLHRDDRVEKLAFVVYHHFYSRTMRTLPTQQSFVHSKLYLAFVRFARHLISVEAVNPLGFVDFLLHVELPIDKWTHLEIYARYIRELNKNETPLEALARNFKLMEQWANASADDWRNFFRHIAPAQATQWIIGGRISPWLLCTAASADDLLCRLSPEQQRLVNRAIDVEYWQAKIARHHDSVEVIRITLAEHGI
jgi:hypothetical protein